ncbi:MAG: ABC transporter permease subunit [Micromonosporaceae bacterium]|nr:ABC transporter permease subunit [Micromonosporaceae bacterium]
MTVLFDAPGPRARRRTAIASTVAVVGVGACAFWFVYRPLAARGQFASALWAPLLDPRDENFPLVWRRLGQGFRATLTAAAIAIVASLLTGTALAVLRMQLRSLASRRFVAQAPALASLLRGAVTAATWITRLGIEVFRGIPVVITIFFVWVMLPSAFGITFDNGLWYLVIGLAIYNSVVIGEILRSGMDGLPRGQREAASAIGLTPFQVTWSVLLPQSYRTMTPAIVSQLVVVLKDTSLGFIITYEESLRIGSQIVQVLENPIQVYAVIGVIFIAINFTLSRLGKINERSHSPWTPGRP